MTTVSLAIARADQHPRIEAAVLIALGLGAAAVGLWPWVRIAWDSR